MDDIATCKSTVCLEMPSTKVSHIVAAAYEAWGEALFFFDSRRRCTDLSCTTISGHQRPLCTMCALLVKTRPFVVTFLVPRRLYDRVLDELSRNFSSGEEDARARIKYVYRCLYPVHLLRVFQGDRS